jgi:hypothetical protein
VTLRARWVTLRARWVTLRARWVTLRVHWVTFTGVLDAGFRPSGGEVVVSGRDSWRLLVQWALVYFPMLVALMAFLAIIAAALAAFLGCAHPHTAMKQLRIVR